ncbi:oxygenase MpaB family protein [Diaminobutyricibacter sp. McL0608]|uniref:oxygenase MpaB family protein n=1 Tax=Leifsonia sp. McL0608 TaxID=3143537 RepID=UPI0031F32D7F
MTRLTDPIRVRLLETLAGQPNGVPGWVREFEEGDDAGFFGPGSATWTVHGSMPTLVAGVRALLMQALHPGALAGVRDWSRFREDPLGRLAGTIRWIHTVTYGDTTQAAEGSQWVLRLHERVVGTYVDARGATHPYAANDPHLLSWVHLAFTDSFLTAHELWGAPIPGGSDEYVREWATAGELMNVPNPPRSRAELKTQLAEFLPELAGGADADEIVRFVRRAPLRRTLRPSYAVLFAGAVHSLETPYRELLGLREPRLGPVPLPIAGATSLVLRGAGRMLGPRSAGENAARQRLERLGASAS